MLKRVLLYFVFPVFLGACSAMESVRDYVEEDSPSATREPGDTSPSPFDPYVPSKEIWVAPYGDDDNDGSLFYPRQSIMSALTSATPGTAIMVKAGTYTEHLEINKSGLNGQPIWLRSADGYGAAKIRQPNGALEAISIVAEESLVIEGFQIDGLVTIYGLPPPPSGGAATPSEDVVIQNNIISNPTDTRAVIVRDSRKVYILNNDMTVIGPQPVGMIACEACVVE